MQSDNNELIHTMETLVSYLRRFNETHWSEAISKDLELLRKGDLYGAQRFLGYFGGMGSLNDLWLCETNGHRVTPGSETLVNGELSDLRSYAWKLAAEGSEHAV